MVYVLDTDGRPLMPTNRHGKVRRLLRDGLAVCVRRTPFTVRLLYVYDELKASYPDKSVRMTWGYVTKHGRFAHGIEKTHCADAYCIADNFSATRTDKMLKGRCVARHSRSLHLAVPKKGGLRRSTVAPHWIGKTRLHRYDTVAYDGRECIIAGSTGGRPILRDILWKQIAQTHSVNPKAVRFLHRKNGSILWAY